MGSIGDAVRDAGHWTFDDVQASLVEALQLWRRSPGGGGWPFAGDGPWHLIQRSSGHGDYDARGGDGKSSDVPLRALPLTRDEVARRDRVSEWLQWVDEPDRRLVLLALGHLVSGRQRVSWIALKKPLNVKWGADALRKRYGRAVRGICERLNAAGLRR